MLCFDVLELSKLKRLVNNKGTRTPQRETIYIVIYSLDVWFQRCSFRLIGQC